MESKATTSVSQDVSEAAEGAILGAVLGFGLSVLFPSPNPNAENDADLAKILADLKSLENSIKSLEGNISADVRQILSKIETTALNPTLQNINQHWAIYQVYLKYGNQNPHDLAHLANSVVEDLSDAVAVIDSLLIATSPLAPTDLITQAAFKFSPSGQTLGEQYYQQLHSVLLYFSYFCYKATVLLVEVYHYLALSAAVPGNNEEMCQNDISNPNGNPYFHCASANRSMYQFFYGLETDGGGLIAQLEKAGSPFTRPDYLTMWTPPSPSQPALSPGSGYPANHQQSFLLS